MEASDELHIVLFPWLGFGHMLPFLELSKSLARRGHLVSFITTPKNIQRLPKVPTEISHLIRFVPFALPRVVGMAESVEATIDLPSEDIQYLMKAMGGLEQQFRNFVSEASPKPNWIVQDFTQHWMPQIAAEADVPLVFFYCSSASSLNYLGSHLDELSREGADRSVVGILQRVHMVIKGCSAVAVRSCRELEAEWLPVFERVCQKKVIPVGLLPPHVNERDDKNSAAAEAEILRWLGSKSAGSVIYVALGSEVTISIVLLHELAHGLEEARLPFLWALRRPFGADDGEILPQGFEERTVGYGKVVIGWVPQLTVLAHGSVGGFLTHCGWGSIAESLNFGHPLVMLPVASEQGLNARMMEEKGIGVAVERKKDGSFTRDEVRKALHSVMVEKEGEGYRKRAREIKEALPDHQRQEKYVDDFAQYLLSHRKRTGENSIPRDGNLV